MLNDMFIEVISIILFALVSYGLNILLKLAKDKLTQSQYEQLIKLATNCILYAEQKFQHGENDEKFQAVKSQVTQQTAKIGLKLSSDKIDKLIESTIRRLKLEYPSF